jgi:hypothetical protein
MGHKPTVRLGGASVLEMVMLGSSVSLASSLRIGSGEVCWIWQSAGASYLMRVFAKRGSRGYLLESAMICNRVMSYSLLCHFALYPDLFPTRKLYHGVGERSIRGQPYNSRLWLCISGALSRLSLLPECVEVFCYSNRGNSLAF